MLLHEGLEAEPRSGARGCVAGDDLARREARPRVGERLRVREDPRKLDVVKQGTEVVRRVVARAGRGGDRSASGRRAKGSKGDKGGKGGNPHRNTIHSTPIVTTRTIERTTLRFRGPAGTGIAV